MPRGSLLWTTGTTPPPQHRVPHNVKWTSFAPPGWTNFAPPLTVQARLTMLQQDIPLPWHVHPYAATALGKQVYNSQFFGDVGNGQAPAVADALSRRKP